MNAGILIINPNRLNNCEFDSDAMIKLIGNKGHDVKIVMSIMHDSDIIQTLNFFKPNVDAVIICGDTDFFISAISKAYSIDKERNGAEALNFFNENTSQHSVFEIDGILCILMSKYSQEFVTETAIPALNVKNKVFYTTAIFKTFGMTEKELRELLKDHIKNKNKIVFRFSESKFECEVGIRYSNRNSKPLVDALLTSVAELLNPYTYATKDITLAQQVMDFLEVHEKTLSIAESFTGGAVSAELVKIEGASKVLRECVVSYSNESKVRRLNVEQSIIEQFGAVSIETVYEMAANSLMHNNCDFSLATTGNAGPSAEKDDECGVFYIAVGNKRGIHIYSYKFEGSRSDVIEGGVKAALFRLYKKLKENEFEEILRLQQLSQTQ